MKKIISGQTDILKLLLVGFFAGAVNGLLGAGGGIIIVIGVGKIFGSRMSDKNDAFATALCVMLPVSVLSCVIYALRGNMRLDGFGIFIIPALLGGAVGGLLLGKLSTKFIKKLFAGLVVISGILLIVR